MSLVQTLDDRYWILDTGYLILDAGCRMLVIRFTFFKSAFRIPHSEMQKWL